MYLLCVYVAPEAERGQVAASLLSELKLEDFHESVIQASDSFETKLRFDLNAEAIGSLADEVMSCPSIWHHFITMFNRYLRLLPVRRRSRMVLQMYQKEAILMTMS